MKVPTQQLSGSWMIRRLDVHTDGSKNIDKGFLYPDIAGKTDGSCHSDALLVCRGCMPFAAAALNWGRN
jgi:hypothetical protein